MGFEIKCDPSRLTKEQREFVAAAIMNFPPSPCVEITSLHVEHTQDMHAATAFGQGQQLIAAPTPQPVLDPAQAFGTVIQAQQPQALNPATAFSHQPASNPAAHQLVQATAAIDLDKDGLPWDIRIHAGTKTKNADGRWKAKRGVEDALVAQVHAELRQVLAATPAAAPVAQQVPVTAQQPWPFPGQAPGAMAVQIGGQPAAAIPGDHSAVFSALAIYVAGELARGRCTQDEITSICLKHGVPSMPMVLNRPDLLPIVDAEIRNMLAARPH